MTTKKSTKSALLSSVLATVLCVAMLVGTTFAWFTDSVTSGKNKIVAGNLDVELVDAQGNSLEGEVLGWKAFDNREQEQILWEPGCTYNTEEFYIKNDGSLNLKFKFAVSGIQGDAKLLEVIDFTAMADTSWFKFNTGAVSISPESSEFDLLKGCDIDTLFYGKMHFDEYTLAPGQTVGPITLTGHMQEEAGNEYQGLSIDGIAITLIATQATGEEDSFNGTYDKDAKFPIAGTEEELQTLLKAAQPGDTVTIDSEFTGNVVVPEGLQDVTIASMNAQVNKIEIKADGIDNVTFDGFEFDQVTGNAIELAGEAAIGTVTFKDCHITGTGVKSGRGFSGANQNTELVFENCFFTDIGYPIYDAFGGYKSLTVRGCTFSNSAAAGSKSWAMMVQGALDTVVIDGCTFNGCTDGILKMTGGCATSFTFTNNTMINCSAHDPYGLFQMKFGETCVKNAFNNTFDGEDFPFDF